MGVVRNGEGIYGLQHAFKVEGADLILMSLWKVDDEATDKLMQLFYRKPAVEKSYRKAFRAAEQELCSKHPDPVYWGLSYWLVHKACLYSLFWRQTYAFKKKKQSLVLYEQHIRCDIS